MLRWLIKILFLELISYLYTVAESEAHVVMYLAYAYLNN
ncbi:hypothetical protein GAGA_4355 [Paraglaciecola agarilytica NO2]|uniref:Uncharacterized protein n=1 Tax=Paraglaciecola agarilytica NO2 TaxID=1125747 RepID=A0ABQ0ID26_9ALTE|nr:hypothetical protein GAGA_4355 [Paraglaciecola agarilytica NO2]